MPGISMMVGSNVSEKKKERWEGSLQSILFKDDHRILLQASEDATSVAVTGYPSYPFQIFNDETAMYVLEGQIYDESAEVSRILPEIYRLVKEDKMASIERLLNSLDGEFLIAIIPKDGGETIIVGDPFCHLPFYYGSTGDKHYVSREILHIISNMDGLEKDRLGVSQYMLFSFCLSDRTFFKRIKKAGPGTILRIHPENGISVDRYFHLNLTRNREKAEGGGILLKRTVDRFSRAMELRTNMISDVPILSLSGGLDSRVISSWFLANNIDFRSISFFDGSDHACKDLEIARRLTARFKKELIEVELDKMTKVDVMALLKMKGGLNDLGLSHLLSYYQRIGEKLPDATTIFTGDSGTAIRFRYPRHACHDLEDVMNELFSLDGRFFKTPLFTISEVSEMTSLSTNSIRSSIAKELISYPEKEWDGRFSHFYYENYAYKWHYEGIDRMRHFIWPMNPLESTPLLTHIFTVPNDRMWGLKHYLDMIREIHKEAANVPYANWTMHPDSMKFKLGKMKEKVFRNTPQYIRNLVNVLKGRGLDPMMSKSEALTDRIKHLRDGRSNLFDLDEGVYRRCGWNHISSDLGYELGANGEKDIEKRMSRYLGQDIK